MKGEGSTGQGFQKPLVGKSKTVLMAVVKIEPGGSTCNCGWSTLHGRRKVCETRTQKHIDHSHNGQAVWL